MRGRYESASTIGCLEGKLNKGGSSLLFLLLFANRTYAHISQRHFNFCFNVLAVYLVKKKLNHRTNDETSNYLCASEILIVS